MKAEELNMTRKLIHDLTQPMQVILGNLDIIGLNAKQGAFSKEAVMDRVEAIRAATEKMVDITVETRNRCIEQEAHHGREDIHDR